MAVADRVGETRDASTLFGVLNALSTIRMIYMIRLDCIGYRYFGTHGLLWTDAAGSLLVCVIVVVVFLSCGLGLRRAYPSQVRGGFTS